MHDLALSARRPFQRVTVLSALLFLMTMSTMPAMANNVPNLGFDQARFIGMVIAIQGPADSPSQVTLQLGALTTDVRINLKTVFSGKSAEADVEGLLQGDFAVVIAHRFRGAWVAKRIIFDVQPMAPLHIFTGIVLKESFDGKRFLIRIAGTQRLIWFRIAKDAQFQFDGRALVDPIPLSRGDAVQVLSLHLGPGWAAYAINVKTTALRWNTTRGR